MTMLNIGTILIPKKLYYDKVAQVTNQAGFMWEITHNDTRTIEWYKYDELEEKYFFVDLSSPLNNDNFHTIATYFAKLNNWDFDYQKTSLTKRVSNDHFSISLSISFNQDKYSDKVMYFVDVSGKLSYAYWGHIEKQNIESIVKNAFDGIQEYINLLQKLIS